MSRVRAAVSRFAGMSAVALVALLASGAASATELYKWTDSKGVVHYSDAPPPKGGEAAQRLRLNGTESPSKPDAAETKPAPSANEATKPAEPAPASLPDTPENRKRLCDQAHASLDLLQSKFQVADSSGKPLDAATRAARISELQRSAADLCSKPSN